MRLADWIRLVIAERGSRKTQATDSIADGFFESVGAGVAGVGDIVSEGPNNLRQDAGQAVRRDPQPVLCSTQFLEVIGFSRARAASVLNALDERLATMQRQRSPIQKLGISPHAPYTVSPKLLENLVVRASAGKLPMAMHIAESADELELLASGTGALQRLLDERSMWDAAAIPAGSRPLDYLQQLARAPRALVIHGNFLDSEEQHFLAAHASHMSLVYCPRTHSYFEHPPYPLADLLTAGVHVALGTDSRASNPDLNLLTDLRHAARTHPPVAPEAVLRLGTLNGAEALGYEKELGSISAGKRASFIAIPLNSATARQPQEILAEILHTNDQPIIVWINGQQIE
jgi:cytosine/adenosine deaminase-related metal-dependent hydrolase